MDHHNKIWGKDLGRTISLGLTCQPNHPLKMYFGVDFKPPITTVEYLLTFFLIRINNHFQTTLNNKVKT